MVDTVDRGRGAVRAKHHGRRAAPPATLRDIAQATGVSQSTVSRVLSGVPTKVPIAGTTRERVLTAARDLGYRPNLMARGLRGARTMLLGVIVRDIANPFFAVAVEAVSLEASRRGYNVVLGHAREDVDEAVALWGILRARHCDAILFLGDLRDRPGLVDELRDASQRVVALWDGSRDTGIPTVSVDDRAGIRSVVDHLVGLGHARIAYAGPRRLGEITPREEAFVASLSAHGLELRDGYRQEVGNCYRGGSDAFHRLMDLNQPPTAIVAPTDVIAIGMVRAAWRRGLDIPRDVSITGFDDIPVAEFTVPALTTLRMPVGPMVRRALDLAIGSHANAESEQPVVKPILVVRESTAFAPQSQQGETAGLS